MVYDSSREALYRGCIEDGVPTSKRLNEIGLDAVVVRLAEAGRMGKRECPQIDELCVERRSQVV